MLVLDNHSIHGDKEVQEVFIYLNKHHNIDVMFAPVHSPFLNPIEYSFQIIKEAVCKCDFEPNLQELENTITSVVTSFTSKHAQA
mgnify:CR=1 FL=1